MQKLLSPYAPAMPLVAIPSVWALLYGMAQAEPIRGVGLDVVIEIILAVVIVFCVWQQFQLKGQATLIAAQREEIDKLEAQVDILVKLQDATSSPNERGALWEMLVTMRNKGPGPQSQSR